MPIVQSIDDKSLIDLAASNLTVERPVLRIDYGERRLKPFYRDIVRGADLPSMLSNSHIDESYGYGRSLDSDF